MASDKGSIAEQIQKVRRECEKMKEDIRARRDAMNDAQRMKLILYSF